MTAESRFLQSMRIWLMRCFLASSTRCLSELHRFLQLCCQSEKLEKIVEKAIGKAVKVLVRSMARQQQSVSLSSCEAELCALQIVACHVCISELVRERETHYKRSKPFLLVNRLELAFFFRARCLSAGLRSWVLLTDQRGIEPPPAVCQRKSDVIPTEPWGQLNRLELAYQFGTKTLQRQIANHIVSKHVRFVSFPNLVVSWQLKWPWIPQQQILRNVVHDTFPWPLCIRFCLKNS